MGLIADLVAKNLRRKYGSNIRAVEFDLAEEELKHFPDRELIKLLRDYLKQELKYE